MGRMLKSVPREGGVQRTSGGMCRGELGYFDLSSSQVALLRGASPSDKSILQAFPCKPIFAMDITELGTYSSFASAVMGLYGHWTLQGSNGY